MNSIRDALKAAGIQAQSPDLQIIRSRPKYIRPLSARESVVDYYYAEAARRLSLRAKNAEEAASNGGAE